MDVLSLDAQTVTDLEYACEGVSPLQCASGCNWR